MSEKRLILIAPSYTVYQHDELFTNELLNRDGCLEPIIRFKKYAESQGFEVHTSDFLERINPSDYMSIDYYSFGIIPDFEQLKGINLKAYLFMEPPVVQPHLYEQLPQVTKYFERVYVHNTEGDGYSLKDVDRSKLHKLYWPQIFNNVIEPLWSHTERLNKIVMINGKHKPKDSYQELYSQRIEAIAALSRYDLIDLYGHGWKHLINRNSLWWPYLKNYQKIMRVYKGSCKSKYQMLSQYQFCLCFENMVMQGYMTEKLFDCFYAGTIPIYWGASDVEQYVPKNAYIDFRQFVDYAELADFINKISKADIEVMKNAGRQFIESEFFAKYYYSSLETILI